MCCALAHNSWGFLFYLEELCGEHLTCLKAKMFPLFTKLILFSKQHQHPHILLNVFFGRGGWFAALMHPLIHDSWQFILMACSE